MHLLGGSERATKNHVRGNETMQLTKFELFYREAYKSEIFKQDFRWKDVTTFCEENNIDSPAPNHLKPFRVSRGTYSFKKTEHGIDLDEILNPNLAMKVEEYNQSKVSKVVEEVINDRTEFVPIANMQFVKFGVANDLSTIIKSGKYISTYITGESGYGKTLIVNQISSKLNREVIRLNCTPFTNEDELIGHYVLDDGNMVWKDGPVLFALKRGAILLLDEVDALDPKRGAFCLFSLLEGDGVFVKKLNKRFYPEKGFNIIATANTKGQGDTKGRHAGTNVQNSAFLDRFKVTLEHGAPSEVEERRILNIIDETNDTDFVDKIVSWCKEIRQAYSVDNVDEYISTRRACDIISLYSVFNDRKKVIGMTIKKFDDEVSQLFMDFYNKIDDGSKSGYQPKAPSMEPSQEYPF